MPRRTSSSRTVYLPGKIYDKPGPRTRITTAWRSKNRRLNRGRVSRQSLNPFPMSKVVKLKYCDYHTISGQALGAPGLYKFACNGIYDSNITGIGHQPMFFDQFAAMYNHYVVLGSKIHIKAWSETAGNTYGAILACKLDDDSTVSMNAPTLIEQGSQLVKYKWIRDNSSATGNRDIINLTHKFSAKKFFGIKDVNDNKYSIGALTNNNPTDMAYWVLFLQHPDAGTVIGTMKCLITIEYIVQFTEPRDMTGS